MTTDRAPISKIDEAACIRMMANIIGDGVFRTAEAIQGHCGWSIPRIHRRAMLVPGVRLRKKHGSGATMYAGPEARA
jgi:hypothetical protein